MFLEQIPVNRLEAFKHLVETKKQDINKIEVYGNKYKFTTKRGAVKEYIAFNSFDEYKKSKLYPSKDERADGFYFIAL